MIHIPGDATKCVFVLELLQTIFIIESVILSLIENAFQEQHAMPLDKLALIYAVIPKRASRRSTG
jgi:hypothetical protein